MLSRLRNLSWSAALLMAGLSGLALLMVAAWLVGSLLSQPDHQPVGAPPADWPVKTLQLSLIHI